MKNILLVFLIFISFQAFSQNLTSSKAVKSLKAKSSLASSLEFLIASEQTRSNYTGKFDGHYNKMDVSWLKPFSKNDELRLYLSTRYLQNDYLGDDFDWYLAEVMYRRKNILKQTEHGIALNLELKNYYMLDKENRKQYGFNGAFVPQLIFKKKFTRSLFTEFKIRKHFFQANKKTNDVLRSEDRLYLTPTYAFSRKFMISTTFKYRHYYRNGNHFNGKEGRYEKAEKEVVTIHPSLLFLAGRLAMLELYVETKLSDTADNKQMDKLMRDEQVIGTAIYFTAF